VLFRFSKFLLLLEEHAEADYGAVDEQATDDAHDHGAHVNHLRVSEDGGKGDTHDHEEARDEAPQVEDRISRALDEVVRVGHAGADPVRYRGDHVGRDDEQRVVDLPERAREDDEQEADCQHKGQGDDGLEAGGWHAGLSCVSFEDARELWLLLLLSFVVWSRAGSGGSVGECGIRCARTLRLSMLREDDDFGLSAVTVNAATLCDGDGNRCAGGVWTIAQE